MGPRSFAFFGSLAMLIIGAAALVPMLVGSKDHLPQLIVESSYGMFLGLLPMNVLNKLALVTFGVAGLGAAHRFDHRLEASVMFSRVVCVVMGVLAVLGLFPTTSTLFGYWPLFGNDVGVHLVFSVLGAYFGFMLPSQNVWMQNSSDFGRESFTG